VHSKGLLNLLERKGLGRTIYYGDVRLVSASFICGQKSLAEKRLAAQR